MLQQRFKMTSLCTDTDLETASPFVNRVVDNSLLYARPDLTQSDVASVGQHHSPASGTHPEMLSSTGLRSGLLAGQRSGGINASVSWCSNSTVSRALWAGALPCWKCALFCQMFKKWFTLVFFYPLSSITFELIQTFFYKNTIFFAQTHFSVFCCRWLP